MGKKKQAAATAAAGHAGPGLTDAAVLDLLQGALDSKSDRKLRAALLSKSLLPDRILKAGYDWLDATIWKTPEHEGWPLAVVAAVLDASLLQVVLAAGGQPDAASACGFNSVMALLVNRKETCDGLRAAFKVRPGRRVAPHVDAASHARRLHSSCM